jgi:hypothetical protein
VLSTLLLFPLAPARVAFWAIGQVVDAAERDYYGPDRVRQELVALSKAYDQGLIDADEFDRREDELLDRLEEAARRG